MKKEIFFTLFVIFGLLNFIFTIITFNEIHYYNIDFQYWISLLFGLIISFGYLSFFIKDFKFYNKYVLLPIYTIMLIYYIAICIKTSNNGPLTLFIIFLFDYFFHILFSFLVF